MNRRGFIGSILAFGAAPAIVRAGSLMPIVVPKLIVPAIVAPNNLLWPIDMYTREALRILENNLAFPGFGRDWIDSAHHTNDTIKIIRQKRF